MNQQETLAVVYEGIPKKDANKQFQKMVSHYNLATELFKKDHYEDAAYDFTEAQVQFLKLVKEIAKKDPTYRVNSKYENFDLENFFDILNMIESSIKDNKYPLITKVLEESVHTDEFSSLKMLTDLSRKLSQIVAVCCESTCIDYTAYNDISAYLDKVLYTFLTHSKNFEAFPELKNSFHLNSKNEFASYYSYNKKGSFDDIDIQNVRMYEGISRYLQKILIDISGVPNIKIEGGITEGPRMNISPINYIINNKDDVSAFLEEYYSMINYFKSLYNELVSLCANYEELCNTVDLTLEELVIVIHQYVLSTIDRTKVKFMNDTTEYLIKCIKNIAYVLFVLMADRKCNTLITLAELIHKGQSVLIDSFLSVESYWAKFLQNELYDFYNIDWYEFIRNKDIAESIELFLRDYAKCDDSLQTLKNYSREEISQIQTIIEVFIWFYLFFDYSDLKEVRLFDNKNYHFIDKQVSFKEYKVALSYINFYDQKPREAINKFSLLFDKIDEATNEFWNDNNEQICEMRSNLLKGINQSIGKYIHSMESFKN